MPVNYIILSLKNDVFQFLVTYLTVTLEPIYYYE